MSLDPFRCAIFAAGACSLFACDAAFGIHSRGLEPEVETSIAVPDASPSEDAAAPIDVAPPDVIAPRIESFSPKNGQMGLHNDVKIVVRFSEPMRKDLANAAFEPASTTALTPTFAWDDEGTVLTIDPHAMYTTGSDPAVFAATPYAFTIATTITDLAGNRLDKKLVSQFTLYRQITQSFPLVAPYGNNSAPDYLHYTFPMAGDTQDNRATRGYMTFDIAALPRDIAEFERASINSTIRGVYGAPSSFLGDMLIEHATFSDVNEAAFSAPPLADLGIFIPSTPTPAVGDPVHKDVTEALTDDYQSRIVRGNLSQYRLQYANSPSFNGASDGAYVQNGAASLCATLDVTYLLD